MDKNNPCVRECPNRKMCCHDTCEKYASFVADMKAKKEWLNNKNGKMTDDIWANRMYKMYASHRHSYGGNVGVKYYGRKG